MCQRLLRVATAPFVLSDPAQEGVEVVSSFLLAVVLQQRLLHLAGRVLRSVLPRRGTTGTAPRRGGPA